MDLLVHQIYQIVSLFFRKDYLAYLRRPDNKQVYVNQWQKVSLFERCIQNHKFYMFSLLIKLMLVMKNCFYWLNVLWNQIVIIL